MLGKEPITQQGCFLPCVNNLKAQSSSSNVGVIIETFFLLKILVFPLLMVEFTPVYLYTSSN
jgi:hypothetical protein